MFFRSARNAEFEVPKEYVDDAMTYVKDCFDRTSHTFLYRHKRTYSRGLAGAGIVSFSLAGEHESEMAQLAGKWLLGQSFESYNLSRHQHDHYFYSAYYCSHAMFQLGGDYWATFYPPLMRTLTKHQRGDGSWDRESLALTGRYGNAYSSALAILALTPPYQILPIYQR